MKKRILALLVAAGMSGTSIGASAQQGPGDAPGGPGADRARETRPDRAPDRDGAMRARPDARMDAARGDWHRRGGRVPQDYRGPKYVVDDWRGHDLQPPPSGYQWLQIDGDFVLAAMTTGVITSILSGPHH
ncbi:MULTISPECIES: RcnB family protein [Burkholderia]|uniref:Membrane protein n=1 Tax=Burkholderia anthina TaxID=179879 RepID=A0A6P2G6I7_9BURK|nr:MULTISPECIES: RcnB family protein [Burkholderia]AXK67696.1 hypothetical protein DCN14_34440 [Burkholderia sp. IDO3]MBM2769285.1 RcnB family protein [Burkholderia anthina]PCD59124.1 hypothetical protein CN645_24755 [Burkholderia sp. IDO3]VVU48956.1 membrane protein [Burkholderia anthina]